MNPDFASSNLVAQPKLWRRREMVQPAWFGSRRLSVRVRPTPPVSWSIAVTYRDKKQEALQLRKEGRSFTEISKALGIQKSTVHLWVGKEPLTLEQRAALRSRINIAHTLAIKKRTKLREPDSKFAQFVSSLDREEKSIAAEIAVLFRLVIRKFRPMKPLFASDVGDWIVTKPNSRKVAKVQVKCTLAERHGLPSINLRSSNRGRYKKGDFDFVVGYDLASDCAYVFPEIEVEGNTTRISITEDSKEAWSKLDTFFL